VSPPSTLPTGRLIPHPPSVGSRFAASGSTPSKSLPSTLDVATILRRPPADRKEIFFVEAGGLRKPGAGRGVQGKACHRRGVASAALHRSPWRPRNLFPSEKIFYLRALLPHATVCPPHPLLLDANMRDANGGYGRAGLKEEILERPGRKRKNARTTDLPDNPNATGRKAWWSGDRERAGLGATVGKKREKAPPPLPAWLTCERLTVRPAGVREQDSRDFRATA
jgi:hypothetical protein